jgi:hypothetical protein
MSITVNVPAPVVTDAPITVSVPTPVVTDAPIVFSDGRTLDFDKILAAGLAGHGWIILYEKALAASLSSTWLFNWSDHSNLTTYWVDGSYLAHLRLVWQFMELF